jgi:hypothetical protein
MKPLFHVVHDQLLGLSDLGGEVVALAPHYQVTPPCRLTKLSPEIKPTTIVTSANLMMVLELCVADQSCGNYKLGQGEVEEDS